MNADHNPRGGLTVDRDSLHASPEYARQVEAAKRLQERSVNADVEKAVEKIVLSDRKLAAWHGMASEWKEVAPVNPKAFLALIEEVQNQRKALRDQEAEIARLRAMIGIPDGVLPSDAPRAITRAEEWCQKFLDAQARTEKADALLREISDRSAASTDFHDLAVRIRAHLSEDGHG